LKLYVRLEIFWDMTLFLSETDNWVSVLKYCSALIFSYQEVQKKCQSPYLMLYIFRAVVYYTDSLVNQLLHYYFIICNMFRPQLFGKHQGERFS
jgi:hypothetical protein